jgi:hypothetical protein
MKRIEREHSQLILLTHREATQRVLEDLALGNSNPQLLTFENFCSGALQSSIRPKHAPLHWPL